MTDDVAKALCREAGGHGHPCNVCDVKDGKLYCTMWETFRGEARVAIQTAYTYQKRERRWPSYVK